MSQKNRHHDEIRVRAQLEAALGGIFLEELWDTILCDGYVRDYLEAKNDEDKSETWEELKRTGQDKLQLGRRVEREILKKLGMSKEREADSEAVREVAKLKPIEPVPRIELPDREKKRADVLLKICMRNAAERPDVKRFRDERLGGKRVLFDEAEAFISPTWPEEIRDWELADLARRLERDYGWRPNEAAWFVLNGAAPLLRPATTSVSMYGGRYGPSHCEITLQVTPWVPPEEVEKAFVQVRDYVRGGLGPGTVSEKRLEVLRFVEEERAKPGRRKSFKELLHVWHQKYPHWVYNDYRALSKAYREAYQEVFQPRYQLPNAGLRETP